VLVIPQPDVFTTSSRTKPTKQTTVTTKDYWIKSEKREKEESW
ncbi:unnamed protein product, partial [marine sediment metagenome]